MVSRKGSTFLNWNCIEKDEIKVLPCSWEGFWVNLWAQEPSERWGGSMLGSVVNATNASSRSQSHHHLWKWIKFYLELPRSGSEFFHHGAETASPRQGPKILSLNKWWNNCQHIRLSLFVLPRLAPSANIILAYGEEAGNGLIMLSLILISLMALLGWERVCMHCCRGQMRQRTLSMTQEWKFAFLNIKETQKTWNFLKNYSVQ